MVSASASPRLSDLFVLLKEKKWKEAKLIAVELDALNGKGDVLKAFSSSVQAVNSDDCKTAKQLSAIVIRVTPGFLPAYEVFASCLVREGKKVEAADLYKNLSNRLPDGPERKLAQKRSDALRPDLSPSLGFDLSIIPSSNTSRRTSRSNTGNGGALSEESRAQDGVTFIGNVQLRKPIFNNGRILTQVSLKAGASYDTITETTRPLAGVELRNTWLLSPKASVYAATFFDYTWTSGERFFNETGFRLGGTYQLDPARIFSIDASFSDRNFAEDSRDANVVFLKGGLTQIIDQNDKLQYSVNYGNTSAENDFFDVEFYSAGIEWQHLFEKGFISSVEGRIGERNFERLAPLTTQARKDRFSSVTLGVSHRDFSFHGIRPELTYTYTNQSSNDLFNDFEAHDVGVRLRAEY